MRVAVFTPTNRYGGLDVTFASLERQTVKPDVWFVADELIDQRAPIYFLQYDGSPVEFLDVPPPGEGEVRNLARAYNKAAERALELEIDLFISLQDYIWVQEDGIERFMLKHEIVPDALLTGLTSHGKGPKVTLPQGLFTVFSEPFTDKPDPIIWHDVRGSEMYVTDHYFGECEPAHWEANWAACPVSLFEEGLRWNEEYDAGMAYENMDFANRAANGGTRVFLDKDNHAISLPHRDYFKGEAEELVKYSNKERYDKEWR